MEEASGDPEGESPQDGVATRTTRSSKERDITASYAARSLVGTRSVPYDPEMRYVNVFCGSRSGRRPAYGEAARALGAALAARGLGLVYGGAHVGLMGEVADAVLAAGGSVIGVIPRDLVERELAHPGLTELIHVDSMHERKARMYEHASGFIALPGGWGTLDELCEILTWAQLGHHERPCGILDVADYFAGLLGFFDRATDEGFVSRPHREMLRVAEDPATLLTMMELDG